MRKLIVLFAASAGLLLVPAAALAKKPPASAKPSVGPTVMYVLSGTLSAFTAPAGSTNGAVTIAVDSGNSFVKQFKGQTLSFVLTSATKVVYDADGQITDGAQGLLQVRGPKGLNATGLQALNPKQLIDKGGGGLV